MVVIERIKTGGGRDFAAWSWFVKAALLFFAFTSSGCVTMPRDLISLKDGKTLHSEEILKRLENESVIFIGESHASELDHLFQLEVIRHLSEKGRRVTVALEVIPAEKQDLLTSWLSGNIEKFYFEEECSRIWSPLFDYYGKILEYARREGIYLLAIGPEQRIVTKVAINGIENASEEVEEVLEEINYADCSTDPSYAEFIRQATGSSLHFVQRPNFCDSQRISDALMAYRLARYIAPRRHTTLVVLLGAAHASKIAVPSLLRRYLPVEVKVLLPAEFRELIGRDISDRMADYIWD